MPNMPKPGPNSCVLVHPVTGRVLLGPGTVLSDGAQVEGVTRDGMGQVVVLVSGGQRMAVQPSSLGRRFSV